MSEKENNVRWYVVNTYSGQEQTVKANLQKRVETMGIQDNLFQILVAEEEIYVVKDNKLTKKTKKQNMYPGYLFVEMIMTDESWYVVRNTPGVTGFIGSSGGGAKPFPVSDEEIQSILRRVSDPKSGLKIDFELGERVRILGGPYIGKEGEIVDINEKTQRVKLLYNVIGTSMSEVDIAINDIGKIL